PAIEHDREILRRQHSEESSAERRECDEDDRGRASLRGERGTLVLERDASAKECRNAPEAAADLAAAPSERAEDDREWCEVLAGNDTRVRADRLVDRGAERHRSRGTLSRESERAWQGGCHLDRKSTRLNSR